MQYGLTVEVHPTINPLSSAEWQACFPDETEPMAIARTAGLANTGYLSIVVKSADKPILLVPLMLKDVVEQDLVESVLADANNLIVQLGNFLAECYTSVFFGRRVDVDRFQNCYVVAAPTVVAGSSLNKEALGQAFRVYTSLRKTMPVALMMSPEYDASFVNSLMQRI